MEFLDPVTNAAKATLSAGITAGATSLSVSSGGDEFPATADGDFNIFIWNATDYDNAEDDPNYEIIRVGARSSNTFSSLTRGQEGTSGVAHNTGGKTYMIALAPTKKTIEDIDAAIASGWIPVNETWAYASATTFTIAGVDRTNVFTKGTKIKLTNNSVTKYFYVLSSSFSTNTTVTLVGETDLVNSAITNPHYSYTDCPQGFKKGEDWFNCSVYADTTQAVVSNVSEALELNQKNYDPNSNFNTGTYLYTAPVTGKYLVCGQSKVATIGDTERWIVRIMVAGGARHSGTDIVAYGTTYLAGVVSAVVHVTKGQTIGIHIMCAGGDRSTQDDGDNFNNYMTVQFLGL